MASSTEDRMSTVLTSLLSTQPLEKVNRKRKREKEVLKGEEEKCDKKITLQKEIKDVVNNVHLLPNDSSVWEYERRLKQITTRGVVKLFNAVNKQQKELQSRLDAVGSSETKRSKVLSSSVGKKEFLDMLKTNVTTTSKEIDGPSLKRKKKDQSSTPSWDLLRDDTGLETAMSSWENEEKDNDIH